MATPDDADGFARLAAADEAAVAAFPVDPPDLATGVGMDRSCKPRCGATMEGKAGPVGTASLTLGCRSGSWISRSAGERVGALTVGAVIAGILICVSGNWNVDVSGTSLLSVTSVDCGVGVGLGGSTGVTTAEDASDDVDGAGCDEVEAVGALAAAALAFDALEDATSDGCRSPPPSVTLPRPINSTNTDSCCSSGLRNAMYWTYMR